MKRKTFLHRVVIGSGGIALIPSMSLLTGCEYEPQIRIALGEPDIPFLNEIAETILPRTQDFGGAKEANVGQYILTMYRDCMTKEDQAILLSGINVIDARASEELRTSFVDADPTQRLLFLGKIQSEALKIKSSDEQIATPHYFTLLKGLVIRGYFTSEIGMTKARNYQFVPGSYEGCISYQKSDGVWAM